MDGGADTDDEVDIGSGVNIDICSLAPDALVSGLAQLKFGLSA